jgi:hypothetical protein
MQIAHRQILRAQPSGELDLDDARDAVHSFGDPRRLLNIDKPASVPNTGQEAPCMTETAVATVNTILRASEQILCPTSHPQAKRCSVEDPQPRAT